MSDSISVVFFASVREQVGEDCVEVGASGITKVTDVIATLSDRGDTWRRALNAENLLVAVNQTMVDPDHHVTAGDEVAFFPPVTGG